MRNHWLKQRESKQFDIKPIANPVGGLIDLPWEEGVLMTFDLDKWLTNLQDIISSLTPGEHYSIF